MMMIVFVDMDIEVIGGLGFKGTYRLIGGVAWTGSWFSFSSSIERVERERGGILPVNLLRKLALCIVLFEDKETTKCARFGLQGAFMDHNTLRPVQLIE